MFLIWPQHFVPFFWKKGSRKTAGSEERERERDGKGQLTEDVSRRWTRGCCSSRWPQHPQCCLLFLHFCFSLLNVWKSTQLKYILLPLHNTYTVCLFTRVIVYTLWMYINSQSDVKSLNKRVNNSCKECKLRRTWQCYALAKQYQLIKTHYKWGFFPTSVWPPHTLSAELRRDTSCCTTVHL